MSRATNDVQAVRQVAGPSIMYLVNTVTIGTLALGLMIWISPRLTAIAMIPMVMMPPLVMWIGKKINVRFERIQEQFSEISNFAQENLAGIRIVKAYGREVDRSEAFAGLNSEYRRRNWLPVSRPGVVYETRGSPKFVRTHYTSYPDTWISFGKNIK